MPCRFSSAALAALSLCAPASADDVASTPAPPRVDCGVVVRPPSGGGLGWMEVDTGPGEPLCLDVVAATAIVWHLDPRVTLPPAALRPGTRVRVTCPVSIAERIEVVSLGPLAMEAAVEEFVADSCGGRLWRGLSAQEVAIVESLGSPSHLVRDAVSRAIAERGTGALRLLVWARRHGDAEVRARAEALLGRLGWERPRRDVPADPQ